MITRLALMISLSLSAQDSLAGPLGDAAKRGDVAEIERLLASGTDANEQDPSASPLHWAAAFGHVDAVELLADAGANLEAQSSMLGTPLIAAIRLNRPETVRALIAAGATLDGRDDEGYTPLIMAVLQESLPAVDALLSAGADPNIEIFAQTEYTAVGPSTALHIAARREYADILRLLREAGAVPTPPDVPANLAKTGDADRGFEVAKVRCVACHHVAAEVDPPLNQRLENGNDEIVAPSLIGVMGRPVGDLDYEYSDALRALGDKWTPELFYQFVYRPMLTAPGTRMFWPPELTIEETADLTAYFASVSE